MHPALWKLYRLRIRGTLRSMGLKLTTVRGALMGVFALLVLFMIFGQPLILFLTQGSRPMMGPGADRLHEIIPVVMLAYGLLVICSSSGERAISFSPSEIDFLFPGPFSRRQLLAYKALGHLSSAIFGALIVSCTQLQFLRSWTAAFVGSVLAILLLNGGTMCAHLLSESVSERLYTRGRRAILAVVILLVALTLGYAANCGLQGSWEETLTQIRHWPVVVAVLAPFEVYARIITAERLFPELLGSVALGVLMIAGVYAVAFWLDANYLETAVRVSQKIQERKRRMQSGDLFARNARGPVRASWLPQMPWCGGVGPLVWRQLVQLSRSGRGSLLYAVILGSVLGVPMVISIRHDGPLTVVPPIAIGVVAYISLLISLQFPLGFRSDFERMGLLKALPLRPLAVAVGQMLVVVLMLTAFQTLIFAITGVLIPAGASLLLLATAFALPYNWILVGADNFLFLLYPSSVAMSATEGMLKMGRGVLLLLAKFLLLIGCAIVVGIPTAIVYLLTESVVAAAAVAWLVLLVPAAALLLLAAWAFRRYDVSTAESE